MHNETKNEYEKKIFNCKLFKIIVNVKNEKTKLPTLIINYPSNQSHKIRKLSLYITEPSKWLQYIWAYYIYTSFCPIAWKNTNCYTNQNNIAIKLWLKIKRDMPSLIMKNRIKNTLKTTHI